MTKVLITGGTGFIGYWLDKYNDFYLQHEIVKLDTLQYQYGAWWNMNWSIIFHLAPTPPDKVIECAKKCDAKIIYASSGAVYDKEPGEYSVGKLHGERLLMDSGLDVRIARMYSFVGWKMRNHFAIINYIIDALTGDKIKIRGDNVTRSYMAAQDMAMWLWVIALTGKKNKIYNVGSENPITMEQLAAKISGYFHHKPEVVYERVYGPDARPYYVPDTSETRKELNLKEALPFEAALDETIGQYSRYLRAL